MIGANSPLTLFVRTVGVFVFGLLLMAPEVYAATVAGNSYAVTINNPPSELITTKIAGPDGRIFKAKGATVVAEDGFVDGDYQYELIGRLAVPVGVAAAAATLANGRGDAVAGDPVGVLESGDFRMVKGWVIDTRVVPENRR